MSFDPAIASAATTLLPDTCFYIDALKGLVSSTVAELVRPPTRTVLHSTICRAELNAGAAKLPPADPRTPASRSRIDDILARMPRDRWVQPSPAAWGEAGRLAGTLARTQGMAKGAHLTLLLDAAILLTASEHEAVLLTANIRDFDLLLQLRPYDAILFYRPQDPFKRTKPATIA